MSLFGTSPDEHGRGGADSNGGAQAQSSLFGDTTPSKRGAGGVVANGGDSSLFAEPAESTPGSRAAANGDSSPWGMPTPKKAARADLVRNLLKPADLPEAYVDFFDAIVEAGEVTADSVRGDTVKKILATSAISDAEQTRVLGLVAPAADATLTRGAFNVLLALIGLVQEGDEASLDSVDERRRNLPTPKISYLDDLIAKPPAQQTPSAATSVRGSPARNRTMPREALTDPEMDPWASPAGGAKGQTRPVRNDATPASTETTAARPLLNDAVARTTSSFTTHSEDTLAASAKSNGPTAESSGGISSTWAAAGSGFSGSINPGFESGGFGSGSDDPNDASTRGNRTIGGSTRATNRGIQETVTITMLPEKEGMFMFQHRNYEVKCARRGSSVIRRYSDFVWLLDCLHKRYPFRQLPLLPPKRVAVNGRHLSADLGFIEKRRRGLTRFTTALVRHPVLSQEQLVVMFLTVPTELAVWRKQATISVQEEFTGKALPPGLEDALPRNLQEIFETTRSGVRRSAEIYINLCNIMERLEKRTLGIAGDSLRFAQTLQSAAEASADTYAIDTNDVPLLNEGINATAKHMVTSQTLLEDEARAWDEGVLEDLKQQRDGLVSVRELFERRDRYARNNIPQLERRIEANENKLASIRTRPDGTGKPGEQEKVEQAIMNDKQSIVDQHARGVLIQECIRDELVYFQQSQFQVSRLHQEWSQERVKYTELAADNWRALSEEVESMPVGD